MVRGLPKVKTHKPLFANKVAIETYNKIDEIVEELEVSKWVVINSLLSHSLGIKIKNPLDLKKWVKFK